MKSHLLFNFWTLVFESTCNALLDKNNLNYLFKIIQYKLKDISLLALVIIKTKKSYLWNYTMENKFKLKIVIDACIGQSFLIIIKFVLFSVSI